MDYRTTIVRRASGPWRGQRGRQGGASQGTAVASPPAPTTRKTPEPLVETNGPTVRVDRAIFTSVRSPTGEGYRIIASTSGLNSAEKTEITRRCPSHGALCSDEPDASGLFVFVLPTSRVCVGHVVHAGTEHTGRGGLRVYTQVIVLSGADYRRFDANPWRVRSALLAVVGDATDCSPPKTLEPMTLPVPPQRQFMTAMRDEAEVAQRISVLSHLLTGTRFIVCDAPASRELIESSLMAMPLFMRETLSFSTGLKFSLSRQLQWSLVEGDQSTTQQKIKGQPVQWFDYGGVTPAAEARQYRNWLDFVARWWSGSRHERLARLTTRMTAAMHPTTLGWIATICNDLDRVDGATLESLDELAAKYRGFLAEDEVEESLVADLLASIESERALREEEQRAKEEAEEDAERE